MSGNARSLKIIHDRHRHLSLIPRLSLSLCLSRPCRCWSSPVHPIPYVRIFPRKKKHVLVALVVSTVRRSHPNTVCTLKSKPHTIGQMPERLCSCLTGSTCTCAIQLIINSRCERRYISELPYSTRDNAECSEWGARHRERVMVGHF